VFLLDTDTIIYGLKGDPSVKKRLEEHLGDPMGVSVVSLMELYHGAYKSRRVTVNLARVRAIEAAFEVIPIGPAAAQTFGELKTGLEKRGTPLDDFDLVLAACALAHNFTLVTNNISHFSRIADLRLVNWAA
jgi:predicted nucleic acid-binding protein